MVALLLFGRFARVAPRTWWGSLGWLVVLVAGSLGSPPARAEGAAYALDPALVEQARALAVAGATTAQSRATAPTRVEVVVGQLDPRLHLAACRRVEPYVPPNARLWGKTRIGLRCAEGAVPWNVYLPVTVRVWGRALVLPAGAAAGTVIADNDLDEADVDLADESSAAIVERRLAVGRVLTQPLKPGQAVRQGHLKARQWFASGETVRVTAVGDGFVLESDAEAISNGFEGQTARVRTESGRILSGLPSGERRLEVTP